MVSNEIVTLKHMRKKVLKSARYQIVGTNRMRQNPMSPVLGAGGEPSTWLPPEGLVELSRLSSEVCKLISLKKLFFQNFRKKKVP